MKTSFENLPSQIDVLMSEIKNIQNVLLQKENKKEEPKYLNLSSALILLSEHGFPMSRSRIYKSTANNSGIPFRRFGKRLVFDRNELIGWIENQFVSSISPNLSIMKVVKSARKMSFNIKTNQL